MMKALSFFFDTAINFLSIFSGPSCAQYMVSIRGTKTFDMQQIKKIACLASCIIKMSSQQQKQNI